MAEIYGLRVKRPVTGEVLLEITDRITRVLGTISTGTSNGTITVDSVHGSAFFVCLIGNDFDSQYAQPGVVINGNTCTWTFASTPGYTRTPITILYGVY